VLTPVALCSTSSTSWHSLQHSSSSLCPRSMLCSLQHFGKFLWFRYCWLFHMTLSGLSLAGFSFVHTHLPCYLLILSDTSKLSRRWLSYKNFCTWLCQKSGNCNSISLYFLCAFIQCLTSCKPAMPQLSFWSSCSSCCLYHYFHHHLLPAPSYLPFSTTSPALTLSALLLPQDFHLSAPLADTFASPIFILHVSASSGSQPLNFIKNFKLTCSVPRLSSLQCFSHLPLPHWCQLTSTDYLYTHGPETSQSHLYHPIWSHIWP